MNGQVPWISKAKGVIVQHRFLVSEQVKDKAKRPASFGHINLGNKCSIRFIAVHDEFVLKILPEPLIRHQG